jgi:hypothetical protein
MHFTLQKAADMRKSLPLFAELLQVLLRTPHLQDLREFCLALRGQIKAVIRGIALLCPTQARAHLGLDREHPCRLMSSSGLLQLHMAQPTCCLTLLVCG